MVSLVPKNVELLFEAVYKKHEHVDNNIKVSLLYKGEEREVFTKILVGGDGALSLVRKREFKSSPFPETYVSIQNWYKTDNLMPFYTSIFYSKITDYYSWVIQKEEYLLIGTAIPKGIDANEKFSLLIETLKKRDFQIGEFYKKTGTIILRTRKLNQISLAKGNVALIGEAAGLISPSSAEGISYDLKSSEMLASSINEYYLDFAPRYIKKCRKIKGNILVKNMKIPFMYNSLLRKLVMKSKIFSMDIKK